MAKNSPIRIEVWRGLVSEVKNVPKGFRYAVIDHDALEEKGEDVTTEFAMTIRERMTEDEFWAWIRTWKDRDVLIEDAEDWDDATKKEELKKLRDIMAKE